MASTATKVGLTATVIEIALCFVLGKALDAMWTVVYAMQFLVFIGMWQINYTNRLRFFLEELKRIALGEFFDDLGIEEKIIDLFGFEEHYKNDGPEVRIGYERFGSPDLFQSFGPTFYMSLSFFLLIILVSLMVICIGRRMNLTEKN